jgi:hypothetical protein
MIRPESVLRGFSLFQSAIHQPGQPNAGVSECSSYNRAGFLQVIIVGDYDRRSGVVRVRPDQH